MKKTLPFVCLLLCLSVSFAQEVNYGVKAGVNLSTLKYAESQMGNKISFHVGGMVNIPIGEKVSIQPEILYSRQGGENTSSYNVPGLRVANVNFELDYLNIPIYLNYNISKAFSVGTGPQVGYLLKSKLTANGIFDGEPYEFIQENDETSNSKYDFGFNLGISYKIPIGLVLSTNYYFGVTNIYNNFEYSSNRVFQVSLGYFFKK